MQDQSAHRVLRLSLAKWCINVMQQLTVYDELESNAKSLHHAAANPHVSLRFRSFSLRRRHATIVFRFRLYRRIPGAIPRGGELRYGSTYPYNPCHIKCSDQCNQSRISIVRTRKRKWCRTHVHRCTRLLSVRLRKRFYSAFLCSRRPCRITEAVNDK